MSIAPRVRERSVAIAADDGYPLGAVILEPERPEPGSPVTIIAGATGVPQSYYRRFAGYLAERGRVAVTFDYRGIGASLTGHARSSPARFRDWGILDTPGVLAWAADSYPACPIHWVGQSYGGFATGLAHNNHLVQRQFAMSAMSADMRLLTDPIERLRVSALLFGIGPVLARAIGYAPGWFNGGADLPKGVILGWAEWCGTRDFLFGRDDVPEQRHFATLAAPLCLAYMSDDPWVVRPAVEHLAARFTGVRKKAIWCIDAAEGGHGRVGHIGFFHARFRDTLWPKAMSWLDGEQTVAQAVAGP